MNVVPAILPHSFEELTEKLARLEGIVSRVQIDLCDGVFGREKTWLPTGEETLPSLFGYEFDLMLNDWQPSVTHCITLGAKCFVAHVDLFTDEDIAKLITMISPYSIPLGIAVSNDKSVDFHADMLRKARDQYQHVFIQVMGISKIGEQGQIFDEETPARIIALKQNFGDVAIQVDGGMTPETAKKVVSAGAETVVVGSYIIGSEDPSGAVGRMTQAVEEVTH